MFKYIKILEIKPYINCFDNFLFKLQESKKNIHRKKKCSLISSLKAISSNLLYLNNNMYDDFAFIDSI